MVIARFKSAWCHLQSFSLTRACNRAFFEKCIQVFRLFDLQRFNVPLPFSLPFRAWGAVRRHAGAAGMGEKEDLSGMKELCRNV